MNATADITWADQLAAALVEFQSSVPTIPKNRKASIPTKSGGGYSYSYADLTDIWDAIRPVLSSTGLAVTQLLCGPPGADSTGITTTVWHRSGQSIASTIYVPTQGKTPQEVGSAITYYKRYALSAALGIVTDEDDDGAAASQSQPTPRERARQRTQTPLDVAKAELKEAMRAANLTKGDAAAFAWVAEATDADIDKVRGATEALKLGKAVSG